MKKNYKEIVLDFLKKSIKNDICYILDFSVTDLKNLYFLLWDDFPTAFDYESNWKNSNKLFWESKEFESVGGYVNGKESLASFYIGEKVIVGFHYDGFFVLGDADMNYSDFEKYICKSQKDDEPKVFWVTVGQDGFRKVPLSIKDGNLDVKAHYNDDLNNDKVISFVNGDNSGLVLVHGEPGTGRVFAVLLSN